MKNERERNHFEQTFKRESINIHICLVKGVILNPNSEQPVQYHLH